jgi:hypothetical protein
VFEIVSEGKFKFQLKCHVTQVVGWGGGWRNVTKLHMGGRGHNLSRKCYVLFEWTLNGCIFTVHNTLAYNKCV